MTNTYTFDNLKEDVRKEAEALRVHATSNELKNINLEAFNPRHYDGCIYGMCTGDCHNERAIELIQQCTPRFFKEEIFEDIPVFGVEGIVKNANGTTVSNLFGERTGEYEGEGYVHYSAIEAYILLPEARNANLIAYLRGETDNLDL